MFFLWKDSHATLRSVGMTEKQPLVPPQAYPSWPLATACEQPLIFWSERHTNVDSRSSMWLRINGYYQPNSLLQARETQTYFGRPSNRAVHPHFFNMHC
jgi:hypothetical protein